MEATQPRSNARPPLPQRSPGPLPLEAQRGHGARGSLCISPCLGPGLPATEERGPAGQGCCGGRLLPGPGRARAQHSPRGGKAHLGTQLGAERSISHVAKRFMGTGTGTGTGPPPRLGRLQDPLPGAVAAAGGRQ